MNTVFLAQSALDHFVNGGRRAWHIGVAHGRVGDDHLVAAVGMGEEVIDPLFLHEPAGEVEVGLAVLDAVVAWLVGPLELVVDAQAGEDLLEDVGHGDLLEDPALGLAGQKPELGDDLRLIAGEEGAAHGGGDLLALAEPVDDAVDVARRTVGHLERDGDALAEDLVEGDVGARLGEHFELEAEEAGKEFAARELLKQQDVRSQRGRNGHRPVCLAVRRHDRLSLPEAPVSTLPAGSPVQPRSGQ